MIKDLMQTNTSIDIFCPNPDNGLDFFAFIA
jgi:hypothetical protein